MKKRICIIILVILTATILTLIITWPLIEPYVVEYYGSWKYNTGEKTQDKTTDITIYFKDSVSLEEAINIIESYDFKVASYPLRYIYGIELISGDPDEYVEIIKSSKLSGLIFHVPDESKSRGIIYVYVSVGIEEGAINDFINSYDNLRIDSVKDHGMSLTIKVSKDKQKELDKLKKDDKVERTFIEPLMDLN